MDRSIDVFNNFCISSFTCLSGLWFYVVGWLVVLCAVGWVKCGVVLCYRVGEVWRSAVL